MHYEIKKAPPIERQRFLRGEEYYEKYIKPHVRHL